MNTSDLNPARALSLWDTSQLTAFTSQPKFTEPFFLLFGLNGQDRTGRKTNLGIEAPCQSLKPGLKVILSLMRVRHIEKLSAQNQNIKQ